MIYIATVIVSFFRNSDLRLFLDKSLLLFQYKLSADNPFFKLFFGLWRVIVYLCFARSAKTINSSWEQIFYFQILTHPLNIKRNASITYHTRIVRSHLETTQHGSTWITNPTNRLYTTRTYPKRYYWSRQSPTQSELGLLHPAR